MSNFKQILWLLFNNGYKKRLKNASSGMKVVFILAAIFGTLFFVGFSFILLPIAPVAKEVGKLSNLITLVTLIGIGASLVLSTASIISNLYLSRDAEFFATLPISPPTIYFAKLAYIYLSELIINTIISLPATIIIGVSAGMSWTYWLAMLLVLIVAPIFPLIISSILALPLMFIVSFFRARAVFSSIALILIFSVVMAAYFFTVGGINYNNIGGGNNNSLTIQQSINNVFESISQIMYFLPPLSALTYLATSQTNTLFGWQNSLLFSNFINLAVAILGLTILFVLSYIIAKLVYQRGVSAQLESNKRISHRTRDTNDSVFKAFASKDFKEILRTPTFALQILSVIVLAPIVMAMTSWSIGTSMNNIAEDIQFIGGIIALLPMVIFMFASSGIITGAGSIFSREGKNFYHIKMLPINPLVVIKAKLRVIYIISSITTTISFIIFVILTQQYLVAIISLGFSFIYSWGIINLSAIFDIKRPKLVWASPIEAVKNNKNILAPTFIHLGFAILVGIIIIALSTVLLLFGLSLNASISIVAIFLYALAILLCILSSKAIQSAIKQIEIIEA